MSARTPTPEQAAIIAAAATGQNLTIEAGAGTGKTATLTFIADATQHRRSLYLAYNKAIATDAAQKFAGTRVVAKTMHALAYPSHGAPRKERMNTGPRMMPWPQRSKIYGTDDAMTVRLVDGADKPSRTLSREQLTKLVTETLNKFLNSGVTQIIEVAPALPAWADLIVAEDRAFLEAHLHTCTIAAWEDLVWNDGKLPFTHDTYLKQWALSSPQLPYDTIFLDEAQDSNPVIIQALKAQQNTQIVAVGDREQAIYGWRGASMSMDAFGGQILQLTTSFRFGQTIADEANWWLDGLDASLRLTGPPGKSGQIGRMRGTPDGTLARSNGGSLRAIMSQQERGKKVHVAGQNQAKTLLELATACEQLQERGKTNHRDLSSFASWREVQNLVESGELRELEPLVKIIDQYNARTVIKAIESCTANPDDADVTVSTAHVAKGLEWSRVRIHNDFYEPGHDDDGNPKPIRREEARLAYVAVTRAKDHLDAGELAWAKDWEGGIETSSGPVAEVPRPIAEAPAPREVITLTPEAFVPAPAPVPAAPIAAVPVQASASQIVLQELIRQIPNDDDRELIAGSVRDGETGRLRLGGSDVDKAGQETAEKGFVAALLALYGPSGTASTGAPAASAPAQTSTTKATPTASGTPTETPAATSPEATPTTTGTPAATVAETPAPPAAPNTGPPGHLDEATAKTAFMTAREWALAIGTTCGDAGAGSITAPASGDGSGTVDVNGLTSEQVSNVRAIIGATKTMFPTADTRWAGVVAIATAYQESTLVNIGYGDYETGGVLNPNGTPTTSIGLYQQQDSWGTREQRLTPAWATGKFLSVLRAVPGWQGMELAKAAHEVQVYALQYYDKYNQAQPLAEKLWDAYEKTSPAIPLPGDLTGAPSAGGDGALPGKSQGGVACAESGTSVGAVTGGVAYPLALDDPYHQITDFFGPRCCVGSSFHRGVDIQGIEGSAPIFAIAAGTVTESAYGSGAGNYVTVQHANGVSTSYWHMVAPSPLKVGDKVQAGQQLGTVGDTGSSFGGHLHLETYDQAGEKVNPVTTLKGMGLDLCAYKISGLSSKQTCG